MKQVRIVLGMLTVVLGGVLHAGQVRFERLTIAQGLSLSSVYCIVQDHQGFLWFGTEDGLNRYDGRQFKILKPSPGDVHSLPDRWIDGLFVDSRGVIWITTPSGLCTYQPERDRFTRLLPDPRDDRSISSTTINRVTEDRSGTVWIGCDNGLFRVQPGDGTIAHIPLGPEDAREGLIGNSFCPRPGGTPGKTRFQAIPSSCF